MDATEFFYEHAGFSFNPATETKEQGRRRGAEALAAAERYARAHGWRVMWEDDPDADLSWMGRKEREEVQSVLGAVLYGPPAEDEDWWDSEGVVLGSLWGIVDPSPEYRRVVAAELALESMPEEKPDHAPGCTCAYCAEPAVLGSPEDAS